MLHGIFCTFSWIWFVILERVEKKKGMDVGTVRLFRGLRREGEEQVKRLGGRGGGGIDAETWQDLARIVVHCLNKFNV